jgi:hypothetical protein
MTVRFATRAAILFILSLGPASALKGASTDAGTLEVRLKDHREAIGDFSRVTLKLGAIAISPQAGLNFWKTGWRQLSPTVASIDLTRYTGKESATVFTGMVNAAAFDAIRLDITSIEAILKKSNRPAAVKNLLTPIKLSFAVQPQRRTVVIVDLVVVDMSDHPPRGYELGVQGYELFLDGKLIDKVPPA